MKRFEILPTLWFLPLGFLLLAAGTAGAVPMACHPLQELCTLSGAAGDIVQCPISVVRAAASQSERTIPGGLEFHMIWDPALAEIQPFTYPLCYEGVCYSLQTPECGPSGCAWASLATGHSLAAAPQDFAQWQAQGEGSLIIVSLSASPLVSAYLDGGGAVVGSDATVLTASFRLLADIPAASPAAVNLSNVTFASVDAFAMAYGQRSLAFGRAFVVDENQPPQADAGAARWVAAGGQVTLDGSGSKDPFGEPLCYDWEQLLGPSVGLLGTHTATAGFQAPAWAAGDDLLTFRLTVSDRSGLSDSAIVEVHLLLPGDVNGSGGVDIADAVAIMRLLAGLAPPDPFYGGADLDGDGKIGFAELAHSLQSVAGLR
jgi:hypothetical protein